MILVSGNAVIPAKFVPLVKSLVEEWRDELFRDPNVTQAEVFNAIRLVLEFTTAGREVPQ